MRVLSIRIYSHSTHCQASRTTVKIPTDLEMREYPILSSPIPQTAQAHKGLKVISSLKKEKKQLELWCISFFLMTVFAEMDTPKYGETLRDT